MIGNAKFTINFVIICSLLMKITYLDKFSINEKRLFSMIFVKIKQTDIVFFLFSKKKMIIMFNTINYHYNVNEYDRFAKPNVYCKS